MSEHEHDHDHDESATLDHNLERLLTSASETPRPPADARARMLSHLRTQVAERKGTRSPHPPARTRPTDVDASPARSRRRTLSYASLGAALLAAIVLAWVLGLGQRIVEDGAAPDFAATQHRNDELAPRRVALADGSVALLRAGAVLDELAPRHLRLVGGEVLLDVVEAAEPLLVETPRGRALVLGTRLLLRHEGERTFAAVVQGEAKLVDRAGELLLHGGEQALLTGSAPLALAGRRLTHEIEWAKPLLAASDAREVVRRGNLIARVPRWTGQVGASPEWPLPIRSMVVDVVVEGGQVRTTIDQTFFNPVSRQLEGIYQFPLPAKAAIARLAMYVDGQRMEAGIVTREQGRNIYEQIVHTRRDPALLEWMQGNLFQIRIFPLPGRTEKRVLLSYTHALDELYGTGELRVPIPAIDLPVGELTYRIRVVGGARSLRLDPRSHAFEVRSEADDQVAEFHATNHVIGDDIALDLRPSEAPAAIQLQRMRHEDGRRTLGVTLRPDLRELAADASTRVPPRDLVVLFDTSASRGPAELDAQRRFLLALLDQLDARDRVALLAFDSSVRPLAGGLRSSEQLDRSALASFLAAETQRGLGLSDLAGALDHAAGELAAAAPGEGRQPLLLLLGDGLAHASVRDQDVDELRSHVPAGSRFAAVSFGQAHDEPRLARLAALGEGVHLHVPEGEQDMSWQALELLSTLATPRLLDIEARLLDASGTAIATRATHASTHALAEGERLDVLAELAPGDPEPVSIELRAAIVGPASVPGQARERWSQVQALPPALEQARWLPRAWARAHVGMLIDEGIEQHREAITALGLAHFLVTPTTSLLVLENEAMYRQFEVHRPALDGWAVYDAPERIEVVREGPAIVDEGELIARTPVAVLVDHGSAGVVTRRTRGFGPMQPAASPFGLGSLGLIGAGVGGGGQGFGGRGGFGFGMRSDTPKSGEFKRTSANAESSRFANLRQQWGWASEPDAARPLLPAGVDMPSTSFSAAFVDARFHDRGMPWPQGLAWTHDARLDDLGEQVPALFEDEFDVAREDLLLDLLDEQGRDAVRGSVDATARERIAASRAASSNMRFRLPEGGELDIDAEGRFALIQTRWNALEERVVYDGEQLRADHPQLGLSVVREVGPTSPALLERWVPWLIPPVEHLERFYVVESRGPHVLVLRPLAPVHVEGSEPAASEPALRLEVELDAAARVTAISLFADEYLRTRTRFAWTDEGLTITPERPRARARVLERLPGSARSIVELGRAQATRVTLPLRSPATLEHRLEQQTPGSEAWVAIQQQRLASLAATANHAALLPILDALREHAGRVLPGELALAGAGFAYGDADSIDRVLAGADASEPARAIAAYLRAGMRSRKGDAKPMRTLAAAQRGTPIGMMASYRVLLHETERRQSPKTLPILERFLADYRHPTFGFVVTQRLANGLWSSGKARSQAWQLLAAHEGPFALRAMHEAAGALYGWDDARAAELFMQAFERARELDEVPLMDWRAQWSIRNTLGEAGWELTWTRLRERVAKSGDPRLALAFLDAAAQVGRLDEAARVLEKLDADMIDIETGLALYDTLTSLQQTHEANAVLHMLVAQLPGDPDVLVRASLAAEQQGRLREAGDTLERALELALDGEGLALDQLRSGYARLFELRARLARPIAGVGADREALAMALAVADRWRLDDPDNAEIDRLQAELLWSLDDDANAWRALSSVIDRHPQEGEALAWLANALEQGGRLELADEVWQRAILVEPTEPTHRLRRAQNLLGREQDAEAARLLAEIREGEWQPRFDFVVVQAKQLERLIEAP